MHADVIVWLLFILSLFSLLLIPISVEIGVLLFVGLLMLSVILFIMMALKHQTSADRAKLLQFMGFKEV